MATLSFFKKAGRYLYRETVLYMVWHFSSYFPLFPTIMYRKIRAKTWRFIGAKVGKEVKIAAITNKVVEPISQNKKRIKGNILIKEYIFQQSIFPNLSTK